MKLSLSNIVIPPWVRIAWKALPWLLLLSASIGLHLTRQTLHDVRQDDKLLASQTQLAAKTQELGWTRQQSAARGTYLQTLENLSTLKDKSDEDTKTFAATPAGAVDCLSIDRVRSLGSYRSALEAALAPAGSSGAVQGGSNTPSLPQRK